MEWHQNNVKLVAWHKGVWFTHSTLKYSFYAWLTRRNHLSTGDCILTWNNGSTVTCVFCSILIETRDHLFFSCWYASEIWTATANNVFKTRFSTDWQTIVDNISESQPDRIQTFLTIYILQATIHSLWREGGTHEAMVRHQVMRPISFAGSISRFASRG